MRTKPPGRLEINLSADKIMTERELDHLTFWISGALLCCVALPAVVLIIGRMLS